MNILLGVTGSVASTLQEKLTQELYKKECEVRTVLTESAKNFPLKRTADRYDDASEWYHYSTLNTVLHIDLIKWADIFLIAPCSANSLAKIANGICDNLLTCCARAWNFEKPFFIAPAMNTRMWDHPVTKEHLDKIEKWGIIVVPPVEKVLFCGDTGVGALAPIKTILETCLN